MNLEIYINICKNKLLLIVRLLIMTELGIRGSYGETHRYAE